MLKIRYVASILMMLIFSGPVQAYDDQPRCFRNLQVTYFDRYSLSQALNFYNLPQGSWNLVLTALQQQSALVPGMMKQAGKKLGRNPLENPFDPEGAEKLLMQVLYKVFYETLHSTIVIDDPSVLKMFNYIRRHKQPEIDACLQKSQTPRPIPQNQER